MNRSTTLIALVLVMLGVIALGPRGNGLYVVLALVMIALAVWFVHLTERVRGE